MVLVTTTVAFRPWQDLSASPLGGIYLCLMALNNYDITVYKELEQLDDSVMVIKD
jgi:hypothetical protein